MAQHAFARPCTNCGTLCTFAGNFADEQFGTRCPCCGSTQTAPNPSGITSPVNSAPPEVASVEDEVAAESPQEAAATEATIGLTADEMPAPVEVVSPAPAQDAFTEAS